MANTRHFVSGIAALALVFGVGPAFAQYGSTGQSGRQPSSTTNQGNSQTSTANTKTSADETFAKKAAEGGRAEVKNGRDENVKNFAAQTLPTLQSHLDQARQMEQAVNQTSSSNSTSGNATGTSGSANSNTYPSNNRTTPGTTRTPSGTTGPSR